MSEQKFTKGSVLSAQAVVIWWALQIRYQISSPPANMKALIDVIFEFGRYPIELEEDRVEGKVWKFQGKARLKEKAPSPVEFDVESYVSALLVNNLSQLVVLL